MTEERCPPVSRRTPRGTGSRQEGRRTMLPDSQLQKLRDDLAVHEKRLTDLENSISAQQIEADVHRVVLKLGRDQGLLNLFGELYVHPELAQEAAKDPAGFAAKRGVTLPADARVTVGVDGHRPLRRGLEDQPRRHRRQHLAVGQPPQHPRRPRRPAHRPGSADPRPPDRVRDPADLRRDEGDRRRPCAAHSDGEGRRGRA